MDVLSHLRSCADVWGSSIIFMLTGNEPTLPDTHPRAWVKQTNYSTLLFVESLKAFTYQRDNLLDILLENSLDDWERGAIIGGRRHTVFTQALRMAKHEAEHIGQIVELIGAPGGATIKKRRNVKT